MKIHIKTEEQLRMASQMMCELAAIELGTDLYHLTENEAILGVGAAQTLLYATYPEITRSGRSFDPNDFRKIREETTIILEEAGFNCSKINELAYAMQDRIDGAEDEKA